MPYTVMTHSMHPNKQTIFNVRVQYLKSKRLNQTALRRHDAVLIAQIDQTAPLNDRSPSQKHADTTIQLFASNTELVCPNLNSYVVGVAKLCILAQCTLGLMGFQGLGL
jgi:hypothetical protein